MLNYDSEVIEDYFEIVAALDSVGSYHRNTKNLDIDLQNRETPLAIPSIENPSKLEFKAFPSHLKYVFLRE